MTLPQPEPEFVDHHDYNQLSAARTFFGGDLFLKDGKLWLLGCEQNGDIGQAFVENTALVFQSYDKPTTAKIPTPANDNNKAPSERPKATILQLKGTAALPKLEWVYGRVRVRKYVSALFSPGGGGKTSLLTAEALDMVSGRDLMGLGHNKRLRVWYINTEDPADLIERQFETAAALHRISNEDIGDRLMWSSGRDSSFVVATEDKKTGFKVNEPVLDGIVEVAADFKPDAIIIDPFVSTHELSENDNGAMQRVATLWVNVADALNCSVDLAHHVVKSDGIVTANSGRGGGALKDKARIVRVVNPMTAEQAAKWSVSDADRREYFSAAVDKGNLTKVGTGGWYHIESVPLGNGDGLTDPQEHAPAVKRWYPPDSNPEDIAVARVAQLGDADLQSILIGIGNRDCRYDLQSKDWAGHEVGFVLGIDTNDKGKSEQRKQIQGLIDAMILTGFLTKESRRDQVARRSVDYVMVAKS
ncbi:MAG: hypothetical protein E5Y03_31845 [Mesorhizobium sp.]|uniref:AAA family ATPase n=1 Tax=Mesorhizobium sp. TaxID=1871066 RepID=UPI0012093287|nr:AAA family ATPase [Mesorhizobium sp.]TIN94609.1 MAG: hypothetical protein E5Y03_31845 [Mesorhizobium sp.]